MLIHRGHAKKRPVSGALFLSVSAAIAGIIVIVPVLRSMPAVAPSPRALSHAESDALEKERVAEFNATLRIGQWHVAHPGKQVPASIDLPKTAIYRRIHCSDHKPLS